MIVLMPTKFWKNTRSIPIRVSRRSRGENSVPIATFSVCSRSTRTLSRISDSSASAASGVPRSRSRTARAVVTPSSSPPGPCATNQRGLSGWV
ncbi:hypothetical protein XF36_09725 [Pseudonocardia sp. HH130629-09]|nr:hypothetical protein XF36_09725 [Pseudonocardia sp. HH130629-09]